MQDGECAQGGKGGQGEVDDADLCRADAFHGLVPAKEGDERGRAAEVEEARDQDQPPREVRPRSPPSPLEDEQREPAGEPSALAEIARQVYAAR